MCLAAGVEAVGDLVRVRADPGELRTQRSVLVDQVVGGGSLLGQGEVAVEVGHDDGADEMRAGQTEATGFVEDRLPLVDAVADVDALLALHVLAGATAGDAVQRGLVGGTQTSCPRCALAPGTRLRHPRGGGFRVGPALGRSNAIPCSARGWGRGLLLGGVRGTGEGLFVHARAL